MNEKKTCGSYYLEAASHWTSTEEEYAAYVAGFVMGQAEKVFLGACRAAMFRPADNWREMLGARIDYVWDLYGLASKDVDGEIWICRRENVPAVSELWMVDPNSPEYHLHRAWLTGIPADEVDLHYHERAHYGEQCEPEREEAP